MKDPRTLTYTELVEALQRTCADEKQRDEKHDALCKIGACAMASISEMVAAYDCDLETAAGVCEDQEDAERRIQGDPLSIEYRATWTPGDTPEPEDAIILLTAGGPAVRIVAGLGRGGVTRAYLQVQDWFTPWTDVPCDPDTLVRYCEILGVGAEL